MTDMLLSETHRTRDYWRRGRFKHLARIRNGQDYKAVEDQDGPYPVIGSGGEFARASAYLHEGESVLLGRKGTIDKPLYINGRFWTVDTMFYTEVAPGNVPKFVYYLATTLPFDRLTTRTALPSMTQEALSSVNVFIPPLEEQRLIAAFLDYETARIDELVREQQRLMALLEQESMTRAFLTVTRGLDPLASMRDSGVDWLDQIPAHWRITSLKHVAAIDNSGSYGLEPADGEVTLPVATTAQITPTGEFEVDKMPERGFSESDFQRYLCREGEILVVKSSGSSTNIISGKAGIVREGTPAFVFSNFLMRVRPDHNLIEPEYLYLLLTSHLTRERVKWMCSTTTYPNLDVGLYGSAKLPLPPLEEQRQIIKAFSKEAAKRDQLINEATIGSTLLRERRSALITAAVTGQIDVRDWQPPEQAALEGVA